MKSLTRAQMQRLLPLLLLPVLLGGCARWFERDPVYPGAAEVGRIEVPTGLVRPTSDPAMSIPPGERGVLERKSALPPDWSDEQP